MFEELWAGLRRRLPHSKEQLRIQLRYVALTKPGRAQLASIIIFNFAVAIAVAQSVIWIASVDDREGHVTVIVMVVMSLLALVRALPPMRLETRSEAPHVSQITVSVDNQLLAAKPGITVVGVSDLIDESFPERVHPRTVIAQAAQVYGLTNDEIADALWREGGSEPGSALPIGHLAWLDKDHTCLAVVFASIADGVTRTSPTQLAAALAALWQIVRSEGIDEVHMPLVGAGFGGAGLPRPALFSLIASSYRFALVQGPVCERVIVHVLPRDYSPEEFVRARAALNAVGFIG